ncbi:hypothetical protein [Spiroplasma endosymbiont of Clivina fossor]|uniref:hypothetical protein n=1 Tax=Spiroplasma endosymbiont of Clivina fossor TaxID=3066282 RepID=UPI00313DEF81
MKKLLVKLFKKDNSKEKTPLKLRIKNSFKKQWLKNSIKYHFHLYKLITLCINSNWY